MSNMDYKYIEQLLQRYWDCETTVLEESILRKFFAQEEVPEHLQRYKTVFECLQETANDKLPDEFDQRILKQIKSDDTSVHTVKAKRLKFDYRLRPFYKAAAAVAMVLSISLAVQQAMYQDQSENVVTLPPAVVPAAPETAFDQVIESQANDTLLMENQAPEKTLKP